MTVDLELSVLQDASSDHGFVAGLAITDDLIVAAGGTSSRAPTVVASSNARHFETRKTPRQLGLRDVLVVGDVVWTCGEYGQLASSRDHGATWKLLDCGTDACLFALALAPDGAVWVVGDHGFAARITGERLERLELDTATRFTAVYELADEMVVLGYDGAVYRWRAGKVTRVATGAAKQLTALATSKLGTWIVVGDGGFIGRSPDGAWFSRVKSEVDVDLEGVTVGSDGAMIVVGDRGNILVSEDDGRQWKPVATSLTAHLWTVERFGGGVLIGGDGGLIAKLAPPGDQTWHDRINVFGGAKPLDVVFANGPEGFVGKGLVEYLDAIEDDEPGDEVDAARTPDDFETTYGVPLPPEAMTFRAAVHGRDRRASFAELRLDLTAPPFGSAARREQVPARDLTAPPFGGAARREQVPARDLTAPPFGGAARREQVPARDHELVPDVGERNLFELLVRRAQHARSSTGLVEAFCGVFCIGSQDGGDTYHMELYEWDGPRQVLHYDHDKHAFTGVFADSLDSLAYVGALKRAQQRGKISQETYEIGLRKLTGKVAPLEPKRRDTELFFYRSRWICALLENDDLGALEFNADFNQVVPHDQLPARYEACERFIPTALYSMWRAYLFDEPELVPYVEIGRRHASRLVRDAATLIDELRDGRNALGTIEDMRARLVAFRALDLDPRRSEARRSEARGTVHSDDVAAELARTPREGWTELAWRWLDDGVAHRALLERLAEVPALAAQLARLEELRSLSGHDCDVELPRLAGELAPELEAVLVGSLVRDDALMLAGDRNDHDDDDDDDQSPGWEAIDRALAPIYPGGPSESAPLHLRPGGPSESDPLHLRPGEPHAHFGTVLPYMLGGNDPIHGISVYLRTDPVPHFHFVTYGFTDLFVKETDDPEVSGFGFELTLRLGRARDEQDVPNWALNFLQNLARYVFGTGNRFAAGHKMGLNGPIALGDNTKITAILFADDPELGPIESSFGTARFVQIVGITDDEYRLIQEWSTTGLVEILARKLPVLVTELTRDSVLDDPSLAADVRKRVDAEGSSEDLTFAGDLQIVVEGERIRITLGSLYAAALPRAMRGRLRHERAYTLRGRENVLRLRPSTEVGYHFDDGELELALAPGVVAEIEARLRANLAGTYRLELWPALEIVVTPSLIRDQAGRAIEVCGVADAGEAKRLIDEDNARLDAEASVHDEADGDDGEEYDDNDEDGDAPPPAQPRVRAALAMSERALRLSPDDAEVQFTHAMLVLDADHAGIAGKLDQLIEALPRFDVANRINVAVRMGKQSHPRFREALDVVLGAPLPDRIIGEGDSAFIASYGDVAEELFTELGQAILDQAPDELARLIPMLPTQVNLLSGLAWQAIQAERRDDALALYDRLLAIELPAEGEERTNYLRAVNNACVQAHAAKAYDLAVRIADRAQSVAHENPYIYHSAACAYAAAGDYAKAFEQVKLAVKHDYDHLGKVEIDSDLGPILEWPEFKALFRDWHDRREGN